MKASGPWTAADRWGGGKLGDVWADGHIHVRHRKVGEEIGRLKSESEGRARNGTVQEAVRALEARIVRIQQPMEQSGRIGVAKRIARTLEDSRDERRNGRSMKEEEEEGERNETN
jgi:hypothetical protein